MVLCMMNWTTKRQFVMLHTVYCMSGFIIYLIWLSIILILRSLKSQQIDIVLWSSKLTKMLSLYSSNYVIMIQLSGIQIHFQGVRCKGIPFRFILPIWNCDRRVIQFRVSQFMTFSFINSKRHHRTEFIITFLCRN